MKFHWQSIHELTKLPQATTKYLENNFVEIFEPNKTQREYNEIPKFYYSLFSYKKCVWLYIIIQYKCCLIRDKLKDKKEFISKKKKKERKKEEEDKKEFLKTRYVLVVRIIIIMF